MIQASLYILAGGQSRRFGGDKARAVIDGKPMLQGVIDALGPAFDDVSVVANHAHRWVPTGCRVVVDQHVGIGPIAGIYAALKDRSSCFGAGWVFVAACDLVRPKQAWVDPLIQAAKVHSSAQAVAYCPGRWETGFALYHTSLLELVAHCIISKQYSLQPLLDTVHTTAVALPPGLASIPQANTQAEWFAASRSHSVGM